ncbi:metalloreductase [Tothia fuscella]|uniref:Metalloreductase n=1 Tax=Tothia fuscella TaxID=1048955 RepID=A0A9P4P4X1_9PEZI|nr:metalloreductase [Tothia fuscella]
MEEYPASGSSSTLFGTATPPDVLTKKIDGFNERSSLLPRPGTRQNRKPHLSSLHAFLMYQPRPIPYLNKALPSNAKSLVVLLFLGINIFYSLFGIAFERTSMFSFADRLGALFAVNLPLLCLLAAKNQPIKKLTGYSYEALNIFHRRVGEMMCFLAVLHMLGMFFWWWDLLRPGFEFTLYDFIFNDLVLPGVGAFFSYELLYLTSLGSFRQRWYEIFLVSHVVLQLAAAIFLWFHYPTSRIWVGISLAIFCIDRLAYRLYLKSATMDATLEVMEDGQTAMLSANWAMPTTPRTRSIAAGWKPTDHVFLTLSSSSWCERLQAHPFTIASAAPNMMGPKPHAWLSLIIRAQDGFSKRLLDLALHQSTIQVRLDGPYGSPRALATLNGSDTAIVIAGGSGIAVAFPLVYALLDPYQNGDPHGTITGEQLGRAKRSVCLVWIVHSRSHVSWLPQERLDELKEWGLELVIPYPTADGGRPNVAEIVQDLVYQHDGTRSAVVVSGPDGMNRDVRNACSRLVREGLDVEVEVEKFGW